MQPINVKTEKFEGPLDLLLHLIEKNEIDIYDIPISLLTDQYMEYLDANSNMDSMSEFVLMAATLLEIKSKMLLPKQAKERDGEEADPRDELVNRLIEYKKFKGQTVVFKDRENLAETVFYRGLDKTLPMAELFTRPVILDDILDGVDLAVLYGAFLEAVTRRELKTDKIRASFKSIEKDLHTVEQKSEHIQALLRHYGSISFGGLMSGAESKIEKIVTFLALLELIRLKKVVIYQSSQFGEIKINPVQQ